MNEVELFWWTFFLIWMAAAVVALAIGESTSSSTGGRWRWVVVVTLVSVAFGGAVWLQGQNMHSVWVAVKDLHAGTLLDIDNREILRPQRMRFQEGMFSASSDISGRTVLSGDEPGKPTVLAGEALREDHLDSLIWVPFATQRIARNEQISAAMVIMQPIAAGKVQDAEGGTFTVAANAEDVEAAKEAHLARITAAKAKESIAPRTQITADLLLKPGEAAEAALIAHEDFEFIVQYPYMIELPLDISPELASQLTPGTAVQLYAAPQVFIDAAGRPVRDEAVTELLESAELPLEATVVAVTSGDGGKKRVIMGLTKASDVTLLTRAAPAAEIRLVLRRAP